ncbi:hypothetical protein H0H87_000737 [Tephrocybe sp. NHM501043]|nr:hypothetical protein H0H87_000737 [Tephrocybe sp. NHM501043]
MANSSAPIIGPSSTTWRRERLMRIGSLSAVNSPNAQKSPGDTDTIPGTPTEHASLSSNSPLRSYGTLPASKHRVSNLNARRAVDLPHLNFLSRIPSNLTNPLTPGLKDLASSRLNIQRPISAYDAPLRSKDEPDADAKVNGIRVWYSSFSSIDWLHDAIKDSARFSRLRKRQSLRSRIRLAIDKSLGWFMVTIIGFMSAIVAFLVVRSEQWLFDTKEGYCHGAWWNAKRFCCPDLNEFVRSPHGAEDTCARWRTWGEVFSPGQRSFIGDFAEYLVYACIAVSILAYLLIHLNLLLIDLQLSLALVSCLLTINLTNSTTFVTRKESGVLSPDFPNADDDPKNLASNAKRKVMYYVGSSHV